MKRLITAATTLLLLAAGFGCIPQRDDADEVLPGPAAPAADKAEAVKGNNAFAFDLYGKLCRQDGNVFVSPSSISTALAMTYAGARGNTAEEMAKVLHFTLPAERLHPAEGALLHELNAGGRAGGYQLRSVSALWGQKGAGFLPEFLQMTRTDYGTGLQEVDFQGATEEARHTINAWVEKKTKDRIKELLEPNVVTPLTRLVLTNAIYFKGNWNTQFKKEQTHAVPFQVSVKEMVSTPLMNQTDSFPYWQGDGFQVLELPYKGKDLSMVVLLPKKVDGLADLEKTLTADKLAAWLPKLHPQEVMVSLPKFKMTLGCSLGGTLQDMGMAQAFTEAADFSGMTSQKVLIFDVIHKAFVDVNEEGTEAAAATAVVVGAPGPVEEVATFRADHPFLFLIRDQRSGSILFLGRLSNPGK